jgi:hypothetical protein
MMTVRRQKKYTLTLLIDVSQRSGPYTRLVVNHLENLFSAFGHANSRNGTTQSTNITSIVISSLIDTAESPVTANDKPLLDVDSAKVGLASITIGRHGERRANSR